MANTPAPLSPKNNICIPIHLDAFALSPDCCSGASKLAPYTQPNYVALRLDSHLIQSDVLDHVDFHLSSSATKNARLANLGSSDESLKLERMGVHLHWTIPRFYRTATSTAQQSTPSQGQTSTPDQSQPVFPAIPNRWLVIRHRQSSVPAGVLPMYQGWVIESDVVRKITEIPDTVDLQSDVAPFVSYAGKPGDKAALLAQAEVFLGQKFDLEGWSEVSTARERVKLTVMNSSNPLFPDYALHNTNVLSMIDNFQYNTSGNTINYCTEAVANYYVIGWHDNAKDDPFESIPNSLGSTLSSLNLKLDLAHSPQPDDNKLKGSVRCLSHGAIYNVAYNRDQKPVSLADKAAQNFTQKVDMEPLSIGTTTLDAIITFLKAHRSNAESILKSNDAGDVAKDLLQISALLYATADEYDAKVQAVDLIAQQNYAKSDGGAQWTFNQQAKMGESPIVPPETTQQDLRTLNAEQIKLDACTRKLSSTKWDLFAEWWKYVSRAFVDEQAVDAAVPELQMRVDQLKKICDDLTALGLSLAKDILGRSGAMAVTKSSNNSFYQRLDPTLCVAGVDSGRPKDFMDVLKVQEDSQLPQETTTAGVIFKDKQGKDIEFPVPDQGGLSDTARRLLAQCLSTTSAPSDLTLTTGFRNWGGSKAGQNPFIPLFLEWEAVYYHIDNEKHDAWNVDLRSRPEAPLNKQIRYAPDAVLHSDPTSQSDTRNISGRILVLPQPTFNLEATVKQVLAGTNPDMTLNPKQVSDVLQHVRDMQFISAPLSGLTNHLLTRSEGAHVKPNVREQGQTVIPLQAAIEAAQRINIDQSALISVDAESALTPYGTNNDFATVNYPFKPVTQGQMIFTKLNIVDKFGQAICVPTPKPRLRNPTGEPSANIYPCLSDYLTPDIRDSKLNTVFELAGAETGTGDPGDDNGSGTWPLCQYMQLTPSINQDARINAAYLVHDKDAGAQSPWRAATDYEQPIWGWIVINYADYGLQFFLSNGNFYQEIRMGGANGTNTSRKYIPMKPTTPPDPSADPANVQLDGFIAQFDKNPDYLQAFFDMINGAIQTMPFPPADYGGYANAIIGKPLALVNVGMSLELAAPAIIAQNTFGKLKHKDPAFIKNPDPGAAYQADLESFSFPLKIGDALRTFDGVVGYYNTSNTNGATDWTSLHTYFLPDQPLPTIVAIDESSRSSNPSYPPINKTAYDQVSPYYLHPDQTANMAQSAATKWVVKSVLVDPYTPMHIYSPILPTVALQLPAWTIQAAMKSMSAFFHLGPVLLTSDVPSTAAAARAPPTTTVRLPISGRKGAWDWWQPYDVVDTSVPPKVPPPPADFVTLPVEEDQGQVKFAAAPYTFVEGYLQLAGESLAQGTAAPAAQ